LCCWLLLGSRPADPWVFRATLDGRPHALNVALHRSLWVSYDAASGKLAKAWQGLLLQQGPAAETGLGQSARASGITLFESPGEESDWLVLQAGKSFRPEVRFLGYRVEDTLLTLSYALRLPDGSEIRIEEKPECLPSKKSDNRSTLLREFRLSGLPPATQVLLRVRLRSILKPGDIAADAKWQNEQRSKRIFDWGTLLDYSGELILNADAPTRLEITFTVNPEMAAKGTG
jgi:hypothetical protein